MLGRLGIAGRLLIIAILVLFASLALGTGVAFVWRSENTGAGPRLPLPDQVSAIVELLENATPENRPLILRAANSDLLGVSLSEARPTIPPGSRRMPGVEWFVDQYLTRAGEHDVAAWDEVFEQGAWKALWDGHPLRAIRNRAAVAVSLKNGGFALFETQSDIVRVFGLPVGFWIGILGALIGIIAVRAIIKEAEPLQRLALAVQSFAATAKPVTLEPKGAKETQALVLAVNDMQTRIARLLASRNLLLGAISHDLKTFITRLRLRIEALLDGEQYDKASRDLDEMTRMIDEALAVARGTAVEGTRSAILLGPLIEAEIEDRSSNAIELTSAIRAEDTVLRGDPAALRRLIANLLDNALRFGERCAVTVTSRETDLIITVDDDGPGIAPAHRMAVFEPFYRIEASRSRDTGGSGLGLAIAKQIVEGHGGSIEIAQAPLGGARFLVRLPRAKAGEPVTIRNTDSLRLQNAS